MSSYPLYLSDELKEKLETIAKSERRSLNAQILYIIDTWVEKREAALKSQGDWPDKIVI